MVEGAHFQIMREVMAVCEWLRMKIRRKREDYFVRVIREGD
jgi:hypothetical protein